MPEPGPHGPTLDAAGRPMPSGTSPANATSPASSLSRGNELSEDAAHGSSARSDAHNDPSGPLPRKRRRTTKACDDCRRKKIKCDGKRPCSSCADFNSDCTYARSAASEKEAKSNEPASKSADAEALEKKLHAAESLLRRILPQVDLSNPEAVAASSQTLSSRPLLRPTPRKGTPPIAVPAESAGEPGRFITLRDRVSQLDLTETGEYDFHGSSSGAAFLSQIAQQFPGLFRYDSRLPFLPQSPSSFRSEALQHHGHAGEWTWQDKHDFLELPVRQLAQDLCDYAFSRASCILRVVHAPSFWKSFDHLYQGRPQRFTLEQRRFVGLLFSVMALGSMYDVDENDPTNPDHYAVAIHRGHNYYKSARHYLGDITETSDIVTLQALAFIIQFLQATGNLNGCHTFVGIALRSALRMGLHRHFPHTSKAPIVDETRRRVFHTIRQMDIYLSTTLGLPLPLQEKDIDQAWPTEVDDEYITENSIRKPPHSRPSFLEASNAHARLMRILAQVVDHLYPPTGADRESEDMTYMISVAKIREIEEDLHSWHESLSPIWRPGPEENLEIARIKVLLRFAYAHVQMMLYRPFLQYYSQQKSTVKTVDERYFALATAGINVCRNIVHIGLEIRKQAVLIGPYWFIAYTQFFAVLSLLLYVLNNQDQPGVLDLFADAKLGKDCIAGFTQRSLAADRVTTALNSLFDNLPDRFKSKGLEANRVSTPSPAAVNPKPQTPIFLQAILNFPDNHQRWPSDTVPTSGSAPPGSHTTASRHSSSPYISRPPQYEVPSSLMDFPIEDPFAYPLLPGVSLADNTFATLPEDSLQLPIFDANMNIEGQLLHFNNIHFSSPFPTSSTNDMGYQAY
ncbi:hypothetical protein PFICI_00113 [Pestalotiopsis fici W106-1]|uniref:Zn(2)-C6 fungal-type domain-containing protein n=1 Tax=Pestalotiopsis fici (strain W106-1 / CGMCC3.15140) TaxID=1229662 RepID=W3XJW2_PESFW|nr:uncharacterized protein PFICI_00113 [Pestalotiopsis fici W106-1]ETS86285.1 hypothetical protein PFICI_00113 [Pestalotiopsis fici W106-1]